MSLASHSIEIITSAGDTFDELALTHCGSEFFSSDIIEMNPDYSNVIIFGEGITLKIPVFDNEDKPSTLPPWRTTEDT